MFWVFHTFPNQKKIQNGLAVKNELKWYRFMDVM